jgi:thiol-disulfide isomerase/thioredoxin
MQVPIKSRHIVNRRRLGTILCGAAATMATGKYAVAQDSMPPDFRTSRSQFTMLRPESDVSSVQLRRFDGSTQNLGSFRGKSLLISLWASWCPPCRRELPILAHLQQMQKSEPFEIIPVSLDRDPEAAVQFIRKLGLGKLKTFFDPDGTFASGPDSPHRAPFLLYGMPMSYVINRHGANAGYLVGEADWGSQPAIDLLRYYGRLS